MRRQTTVLGISFIIPLTANLLFISGLLPPIGINPTPLVLIPASLLQAWVVLGTRILDIIPLARSMVLDRIDVGTVVLDANWRIADINRAALDLIGLQEQTLFGYSAERLPPPWNGMGRTTEPIQVGGDEEARWIRIEKTAVTNNKHKTQGTLLLLKDVTSDVLRRKEIEQKRLYEQQQKQQCLQQLLLRDIHDGFSGLTSNLLLMSVLAQKEQTSEKKNERHRADQLGAGSLPRRELHGLYYLRQPRYGFFRHQSRSLRVSAQRSFAAGTDRISSGHF